jgi:hypothetical protein
LAGELTAVYRGSGGAEADIQRYIQQMSRTPRKRRRSARSAISSGLLKSRLDALNDQYRQGMGTTAQQLQLLDPQAQLIVQHLGGFDAAGAPTTGNSSRGGGGPRPPNDPLTPAGGGTKGGYRRQPDSRSPGIYGAASGGTVGRAARRLSPARRA